MYRFASIVLLSTCRYHHQPRRKMAFMFPKPIAIIDLKKIFEDAVESVKPKRIFQVDRCLELQDEKLIVRVDGESTEFDVRNKRIHVVGFGKAVYGMAVEVEAILKERLTSGIVSVPVGTGDPAPLQTIRAYEGANHNLPDEAAFATTKMIVEKCESLTQDDVLICLISGGGSALLTYPKSPLTVQEKCDIIKDLANGGAKIEELNTVRIQLSEVKGGRLAQKAGNAYQVISLIISDIIGDPLKLIASGPTVLTDDAIEILEKYNVDDQKVKDVILQNKFCTRCPPVANFIVACNTMALTAAAIKAESLCYRTAILSRQRCGDVKTVCSMYERLAIGFLPPDIFDMLSPRNPLIPYRGIVLISGGETTVTVTGDGLGGRNQELAMRFARHCTVFDKRYVFLLAAGTDGIDGPTDAAGAIGCFLDEVYREPVELIDQYIARNDSFNFYRTHTPITQIKTGHTGTNVMDLHLLMIKPGA